MGTVHLTNGHHGLYIREPQTETSLSRRIALTPEILARPIVGWQGDPIKSEAQGMIRAALQALMDMPGFNAAVSFCAKDVGGVLHLMLPHREWGEITLGTPDNVVVGFSHDTRVYNAPFYRLLQWLEEDYPGGELSEEDFAQFAKKWSSVEQWTLFFEARICRNIMSMSNEAQDLQRKASDIVTKITAIETALNASL
jgi:hypothetical protein